MKTLFLSLLAAASCSAGLVEKSVEYKDGDVVLEGFHVYDDAVEGKRPAILVVHQWTGITEHEKERSRMLAKLGYNVLAADIYGKGVRPQPPEAGTVAGKYKGDRKLFRARLNAGLETLKVDERSDATKIAAIGFCFGGTGVLELARDGAEISGVVSFHGGLDAADGMEAGNGGVKTRILVCHGAEDPHVPADHVAAFHKEMTGVGADWQMISYGGAVHAFTQKSAGNDVSKGAAYDEKADQRSWRTMMDFLAEAFAK